MSEMLTSLLSHSENPNPELISHVEQYGGKLGVLELISKKYQENPEPFDKIGIKVWPWYTPTIITSTNTLSKDVWEDFLGKHNLIDGEWRWVLLRASLPWDYRSLIDVIRTDVNHLYDYENGMDSRSRFLSRMDETREFVDSSQGLVHYAELAWVPFDPISLSFWLIPEFKWSRLIVTEHPNHEWQLIEEWSFKKSLPNKIFRIHDWWARSENTRKVAGLLALLRSMNILDEQVAYNLELWVTPTGEVILFQIREFCKKVLVERDSLRIANGRHSEFIETIMTTLQNGVQKVFQSSERSIDRYSIYSSDPLDVPKIAQLWWRGCPLGIINLDPNLHGISTENMYASVGQHENMRFMQYALGQPTWWIVLVWSYSDWRWSFSRDLWIIGSSFNGDAQKLWITRVDSKIHIEKL